ncbi:unnamed protein product [Ambrosiozyma monospora]|uniref:Unnamed protein product n=1 Tax=Ambrosiozyma monospora TaxID=43982 RepID=A0ACB5TH29_AMBMO|nr:unnamed protein product [Ambrosiozyma monospora]
MNSPLQEADSHADATPLDLLPDIEAGVGTSSASSTISTLSENKLLVFDGVVNKLNDDDVDICMDLLLREVENSRLKEAEKGLPLVLKIIIVLTIFTSLYSGMLLLMIIFVHYPLSPSILLLADAADEYLKDVSVAPGMVFFGFGFLCFDFDSLFLQSFVFGNLAYFWMYIINHFYMLRLLSNILIGCGMSPPSSYLNGWGIWAFIFCISYLLTFVPRKYPDWKPDYNSTVLSFPYSRYYFKCFFFLAVIPTCYLEILHCVTVTKWQYQDYLSVISDRSLTSNPYVNVLLSTFLWSTAAIGITITTYAFSCVCLKKECTVNKIKNRY